MTLREAYVEYMRVSALCHAGGANPRERIDPRCTPECRRAWVAYCGALRRDGGRT